MSTHKHFDKICCVVLAVTLLLTTLLMFGDIPAARKTSTVMGYENKLFDVSRVHTVDIVMDNWDEFIESCKSEKYYNCAVVIDNESYKNVAIRGKGNTSLTRVDSYGNNRYSFKIEFDHYDSKNTYYGLDKLCLNNIIQDNTYMKDYLTYRMMSETGVASPLCSFAYITVNGEDWGLYLAVEGVEESFLERNYGSDYGELYKPDSISMGGGRGNGGDFDMNKFLNNEVSDTDSRLDNSQNQADNSTGTFPPMTDEAASNTNNRMPGGQPPGNNQGGQMPGGTTPPADNGSNNSGEKTADNAEQGGQRPGGEGNGAGRGSDDVLLKYIDDDAQSYSNIFDNAKTNITGSDKTRLIESLKKLSSGEDISDAVDIEAVIRYFAVHNFVLNFDSYTGSMIHNYYLYEKDGIMQMIPWDYNLAFGGFQSSGNAASLVNYPIDSPVSGGNTEDRPMIAWIFANEEYTEMYHKCLSEFISGYFESGYFENMIDSVISMISPYVEKDPTKFCTYEEFEKGASTLKEFCLLRAESVRGQLNGTIGSTSDSQDSTTFIDAGDLKISDMGSMGNSDRGGNKTSDSGTESAAGNNAGQTPTQMPNANTQGAAAGEQSDSGTESTAGNNPGQTPQGHSPQNNSGQTTASGRNPESLSSLVWIAVSVAVLAFGLCFALLFKRRK